MRRRKRMREELDEDIRKHLARETEDNIERGMSPEEAGYAAMRKRQCLAGEGGEARSQELTRGMEGLRILFNEIRVPADRLLSAPS